MAEPASVPPEAVEDAAAPIAEMFPGLGLETARKIATMALEAAGPHMLKAAKTERILSAIFACNSADCPRPFALQQLTKSTNKRATFSEGKTITVKSP